MQYLKSIILSGCILLNTLSFAGAECVLKMTYKEGDKLPLIAKKPDNSGAYLELFSRAAETIGCQLEIVRLPKKKLHEQLQRGTLDFYPAASFSEARSKYLYYIENGMPTGEYGITSRTVPDILDYPQVKELGLVWLMELGSSKAEKAAELGIRTHAIGFVDIEKVQQFISQGRKYFYVSDKELADYYVKNTGVGSFEEVGLKVHYDCCGGEYPMRMAFSRFSPHFKEKANPRYDGTLPVSPTNFPTVVDSECVAYKFGQALQQLKDSGETMKIYTTYFSE